MIIIKIKYSFVKVNNYQGGDGKVIIKAKYINIPDDTQISKVNEICENVIQDNRASYRNENISLLKIEIIGVNR